MSLYALDTDIPSLIEGYVTIIAMASDLKPRQRGIPTSTPSWYAVATGLRP